MLNLRQYALYYFIFTYICESLNLIEKIICQSEK